MGKKSLKKYKKPLFTKHGDLKDVTNGSGGGAMDPGGAGFFGMS